MTAHYLIIGGGVAGLTAADELIRRGNRVTVWEAAPEMGGLTSAHVRPTDGGDPIAWDRFYHVISLTDSHTRGVLKRLGLDDEVRWVETKTGFYAGGRLHSMSTTAEFLRFKPLSMIERLRLGGTIFYLSKIGDWRRLEKIPVADFLRRVSGRGAFEKIWLPLLKAKLGDAYRETSAAFIWAHTQRMYRARRSGAKKEMFGYIPGGYRRIVRAWTDDLASSGVAVETGRPVASVAACDGGGLRVVDADGRGECFDGVIATVPSPRIAAMAEPMDAPERDAHRGIRYLGVVCASMLLKKPISPYYVTNIVDDWVPLTAVIEMTAIVDPSELDGHHLVYLPKYAADDSPELDVGDDDYRERCLSTLEKMYPEFDRDDVVDFRVSRAKYVAALATVGYSDRLPDVATSLPGFYAVNTAQILEGNLNVDETIKIVREKMSAVA